MRRFRNLEIHLAHSCNLVCESCDHYSNQGHKGILSLDEADRWMGSWNRRLQPAAFSLLGGEPTLNPDLVEFVRLARRHWPSSHLRLVTNGFFLHRHPDLPIVLGQAGNAGLYLSIHHHSHEYVEKVRPIIRLLKNWQREHNVQVTVYESNKYWQRRYKGFGVAMEPFEDEDTRRSWEGCLAKYCPQLFGGKIWKCAPLAYLPMQAAKYALSEKWRPYLGYQPLEPDCSDAELNAFFDREEESACGMCPAKPERFMLPLPLARSLEK